MFVKLLEAGDKAPLPSQQEFQIWRKPLLILNDFVTKSEVYSQSLSRLLFITNSFCDSTGKVDAVGFTVTKTRR